MQGDWEGSLRSYAAVLRTEPDHGPTLEAIARCWAEREVYDSALHYGRRAAAAAPDDLETRRLLAELWIKAGTFDSAAAEYEHVLEHRPNDLQARYSIARTWERRDPARAMRHYAYIRDNIAEDFNTLFSLYELQARRRDYDGAAATLRLLLAHHPDAAVFYEMLCGVWTDAGRYDSAVAVLAEADLNVEDDAQLDEAIGAMLQLTELRLRGLETGPDGFQRFADSLVGLTARRLPGFPRSTYQAGMIALRRGSESLGDSLLHRAFRSDELTAIAWTEAAALYLKRSSPQRLLSVLGPSAVRYEQRAEVCYRMGTAWREIGNRDSAIRYLRRALEVDPAFGNAWWELARLQIDAGQTGPAIASFEEALSADPYNPELLNDYAVTLARLAVLLKKGVELADRALGIEPENEAFLTTRGWIAYLERDYETAVEYLRRAVDAGGATAERLELLGDACRADGDEHQALDAYTRALRVNGEDREREIRLQQKLNGKGS